MRRRRKPWRSPALLLLLGRGAVAVKPACFTQPDHYAAPLAGSWQPGHALPFDFSCPFLRPWENCSFDDPSRAGRVGARRFVADSCRLRTGAHLVPALHARLANRTLLFAGESFTIQQYVAMVCLLHAVDPSSPTAGPGTHYKWRSPDVLNKRCHGEKRCHYEAACQTFSSGLRVCSCGIMGVERRLYSRCFRSMRLGPSDVVLYGSVGVHYSGGGDLHQDDYNITRLASTEPGLLLNEVGYRWKGSGFQRGANSPTVIWREVPPQHFPAPGGHYWRGLSPDGQDYNVKKDQPGQCVNHSLADLLEHHRWNRHALPIVEAAGV